MLKNDKMFCLHAEKCVLSYARQPNTLQIRLGNKHMEQCPFTPAAFAFVQWSRSKTNLSKLTHVPYFWDVSLTHVPYFSATKCGEGEAADNRKMSSMPLVPFCTNCLPSSCPPGACSGQLQPANSYWELLYVEKIGVWAHPKTVKEEDCLQICKDMQDCAYIVYAEASKSYLGRFSGFRNCLTFPSSMIARAGSPPAIPVNYPMDPKVCSCSA
jgi:hypothetical protein